jgi:hypothetical protein
LSQRRASVEYARPGSVCSITKLSYRPKVGGFFIAHGREVVFDRLSREKRLYSANDPPSRPVAGVQVCWRGPSGPGLRFGGIAPRHSRPLPSAADLLGLHPEGPR